MEARGKDSNRRSSDEPLAGRDVPSRTSPSKRAARAQKRTVLPGTEEIQPETINQAFDESERRPHGAKEVPDLAGILYPRGDRPDCSCMAATGFARSFPSWLQELP